MPLLQAPEHVIPALPTHAPIELQCAHDDWVYVVARWPTSIYRQTFVWRVGDDNWTKAVLR